VASKWVCRIHGQDYTVDIPCEDQAEAEVTAFEHISRGIRYGNKIYPNSTILYCELIEKKETDGQ